MHNPYQFAAIRIMDVSGLYRILKVYDTVENAVKDIRGINNEDKNEMKLEFLSRSQNEGLPERQ